MKLFINHRTVTSIAFFLLFFNICGVSSDASKLQKTVDTIQGRNNSPSKTNNENEIKRLNFSLNSYRVLTASGVIAIACGGGMVIGGVFMKVKSNNPNSIGNSIEETSNSVAQVVLITVGSMVSITGIILTAVGATKLSSCKERLKGLSADIISSPSMQGVKLTYKF